ncbi:MAG: ABC transporter ATP-binding protein [Azospirillaceae bacterium]
MTASRSRPADPPPAAATAAASEAPAPVPEDLEIFRISKSFDRVRVLEDCSLRVARGEVVALLGPSGCGKSTLLNIVAGFERPDGGDVSIRGRTVDGDPPNRRATAMVFQNYALFPHMTVRANIGYGLAARRLDRRETAGRVAEALALLRLDGLEDRYPNELSGGQQQRVAIARAIATRPDVLLLDEALSALDKTLREAMQVELSLLVRRLGVTTIMVTHDQREAFAMADRIAIMHGGRILQVGRPDEIYGRPKTAFVVEFLGSVNRLPGTVTPRPGGGVRLAGAAGLDVALPAPATDTGGTPTDPSGLAVYLRASDVDLASAPTDQHSAAPATVTLVSLLGATRRIVASLGDHQVISERPDTGSSPAPGDAVYLAFDPATCHVVPQ